MNIDGIELASPSLKPPVNDLLIAKKPLTKELL